MDVVRLADIRSDGLVLHYGGRPGVINARTLGASLVAFCDLAVAVANTVAPEGDFDLIVEETGEGSFIARLRAVASGQSALFSILRAELLSPFLVAVLTAYLVSDDKLAITVDADEVVIVQGDDHFIIPRGIYDMAVEASKAESVREHTRRHFQALEDDQAVTSFGISPRVEPGEPTWTIKRDKFERLAELPVVKPMDEGPRQMREREATLLISKAWLKSGKRKWTFQWNGVPISAPITDPDFLDELQNRKHLFGSGDTLDVILRYEEVLDLRLGVYRIDYSTMEVVKVVGMN